MNKQVESPKVAEVVERQEAPDIEVLAQHIDRRMALLTELDRIDPGHNHSYQAPDVTADQLSALGQEIVTRDMAGMQKGDNSPARHKGDIVVRMKADRWVDERASGENHSYRRVVKTLGGSQNQDGKKLPNLRRVPKPRSRDEIEAG